ncbi:hypothetical protein C1Y40_02832 [Mycobacterium talmoniae]|uniref:Uncharacterized protein n=1 Tax=Mycobacterium talmoniae TaxID=1858794 RepID=A0A2S8BJY5_9MYCO|nr:hypothetical protein C1Y40_02832 [Mycobacterium talmoniae]
MPRTAVISGSWLTRAAICSRSASALGLRRSCGDWITRYCGMVALSGKWRLTAAYPRLLSTLSGSVVRWSQL